MSASEHEKDRRISRTVWVTSSIAFAAREAEPTGYFPRSRLAQASRIATARDSFVFQDAIQAARSRYTNAREGCGVEDMFSKKF